MSQRLSGEPCFVGIHRPVQLCKTSSTDSINVLVEEVIQICCIILGNHPQTRWLNPPNVRSRTFVPLFITQK